MMPVYILGGILVFGSIALILFFVIKNLIKGDERDGEEKGK